ncbi:MAG: hypothetical protein R3213_12130, partial [Flavobacteriaceae bacterium]|nr:hypothetical protein [Flavobacteriaceae bacterium]
MDTGLLTYRSPTGRAFFWSGSLPHPQCTIGSTKVDCPHRITRTEAQNLVNELCKLYPDSIFCLKGCRPKKIPSDPKMGMVVSPEGHGVGIVTQSGDIRSLSSPVPHPLPSIAHESGTVPIVKAIEPSDAGQLSSQIVTKRSVDPIDNVQKDSLPSPTQVKTIPVSTKPIKNATTAQEDNLLSAIQKGVKLKKAGKQQTCQLGYYWSQKLGRCIAVSGTPPLRQHLISQLQKKFANLP